MANLSAGLQEDLAVAENAFQRILGRVMELHADEYHEFRMILTSLLEQMVALEKRPRPVHLKPKPKVAPAPFEIEDDEEEVL